MNFLYGFTVQGIQSYIFQTNNLREIIGASEIVELVCKDWFDDFIKKKGILGKRIQNAAGNIKFLTSEENAKVIFKEFGEIVNEKAPGLPFSQAIVEGLDFKALDIALSAQRNQPLQHFDLGHMSRFMARTTGDLAVPMVKPDNIKEGAFRNYKDKRSSIDKVNFQKFITSETESGNSRLLEKAGIEDGMLVHDFEDMAVEGKHSWLALIHIDGNGMGEYIRKIPEGENRSEKIRDFAESIAECTEDAFKEAYKQAFGHLIKDVPFRPIILGGDDVTVICRADFAFEFTKVYLQEYEKLTKENIGQPFTACTGIAFVKAKFPFHYTADLVEDLCSAAKKASGRKYSAVLFHKVSDSFISDYQELVERELTVKGIRISKDHYSLPCLLKLIENTEKLKNEKGIKNAMRQWVDLSMNESPEATLIQKRAAKKYDKFKDIDVEQYADYLTLFAIR